MITYKELMYLMTGLIVGFIIGAIIVTALFVFMEKSKNER